MQNKRIEYLDVLRGIAILFVVFGHVTHIAWLRTYIWGFHIPLFFFISGMLFDEKKYHDTFTFIKIKTKNLLIPYAIFYMATFIYWLIIERHWRGTDVPPYTQLLGLFYGTYNLKYMLFNGALWFIPCLFSIELIYWFIAKVKFLPLRIIFLFISYIAGVLFKDIIGWLPFGICAACIGVIFFATGNLLKDRIIKISTSPPTGILFGIFAIGFCVQTVLLPYTGADLAALSVKNEYSYIPIAFIGIGTFYCLSIVLKTNTILKYMGRNSLVIFAFQEPVYRAIIFIVGSACQIDAEELRRNLLLCLLVTAISIVAILPEIYVWNRWITPSLKKIKV